MRIKVTGYEDCSRTTYITMVDGQEHLLAGCSLGSYYTYIKIIERARFLFGNDVILDLSAVWLETEQPTY